jgi:hypothetical protein
LASAVQGRAIGDGWDIVPAAAGCVAVGAGVAAGAGVVAVGAGVAAGAG